MEERPLLPVPDEEPNVISPKVAPLDAVPAPTFAPEVDVVDVWPEMDGIPGMLLHHFHQDEDAHEGGRAEEKVTRRDATRRRDQTRG